MGSKDFREDYIEYLERNNANLQNQSARMKEFESRLLNKELRSKHCELALEDIKNICNSTCEAIDNFFENFTTTMNSFKNVLMWKSQVLLIPQRLALALYPDFSEVSHTSGSSNSDSGFSSLNDNNQSKNGRKCGTAKVCPMIKGHVISAPRIHLNRVSEDSGPQSKRPLTTALSPIIEQSPVRSPDEAQSPVFRNIQIPLHRLRIGNFVGKKTDSEDSFRADSSPKINFKRRKCSGFELRKRYSSLGENERFRMMRDRHAEVVNASKREDEITEDEVCVNVEAANYSPEVLETCETHDRNVSEDIDPLEGPSWLLDKQQRSEESDHSALSSSQCRFVNFKRLNYTRSNRGINGDKRDVLNFNDDAQMGNFELSPSHSEEMRESSFPLEKQSVEKNSSNGNEESSSEHSSSLSIEPQRPEEYDKFDISDSGRTGVNSLSFKYSSMDRNSLERKSIHEGDDSLASSGRKSILRRSSRSGRLSNTSKHSRGGKKSSPHELLMDCSVNLSKLPRKIGTSSESETPKRWNVMEIDSIVDGNPKGELQKRRSNRLTTQTIETQVRTKRRAAEQCIENKVWLDVTPRWEAKIKREEKATRARKGRNRNIKAKKEKNTK